MCEDARFRNPDGISFIGDGLIVDRDMFFREGFVAEGQVRLSGAHVSGRLICLGTFINRQDPALNLEDAEVAGILGMRPTLMDGCLDLTNARVGTYLDDSASWPAVMRVVGFSYNAIEDMAPEPTGNRLDWLRRAEGGYSAQPYEQLARAYRRVGREVEAGRVVLAKQRRRRATLGVLGRAWGVTLDFLVGYGYRPWLAGLWMGLLLLVGTIVNSVAYAEGLLTPANQSGVQPEFQPFIYTLDVVLPILNLHQREAWAAHGFAQWVMLGLTAAGWFITTAIVLSLTLGFTGVLSPSERTRTS